MPYQIIKDLGEGTFGKVFLLRVPEGRQYALKVSKTLEEASKAQENEVLNDMEAEAKRMMDLSHPHVVQCGEFARVYDRMNVERVYLVLEYYNGGSLRDKISPGIAEAQACVWFSQMADAIKYLHEMKIMHRDIKPENILLDANRNIKMGDLGIAWDKTFTSDYIYYYGGSPFYMSPQILKGERYTKKTDIWSLGCVFHELLYGQPTFNDEDTIVNGEAPPLPIHYSSESRKLVKKMLEKNELKRLDSKDVFNQATKLLTEKYQQIPFDPMDKPNLNKEEVTHLVRERGI